MTSAVFESLGEVKVFLVEAYRCGIVMLEVMHAAENEAELRHRQAIVRDLCQCQRFTSSRKTSTGRLHGSTAHLPVVMEGFFEVL